jgi:hypothetical protein
MADESDDNDHRGIPRDDGDSVLADRRHCRGWPDADDGHAGIPRDDAGGNPVFLILPPAMRAEYERKLAACEAGWQATRDPAAVMEAMILAACYRQPIQFQSWTIEAACAALGKRRTKGYVTRHHYATIRWMRYTAVRDSVARTWPARYEDAANKLANTPAAADALTMKEDYARVARDLREGRGAQYFYTPKIPKLGAAQTARA